MLRDQSPEISISGKVRHRTRILMPEGMDAVVYCASKDSFAYQRPQATVGKLMNNRYLSSHLFLSLLVAIGIISQPVFS